MLPLIIAFPLTSNNPDGVKVPMPNFPSLVKVNNVSVSLYTIFISPRIFSKQIFGYGTELTIDPSKQTMPPVPALFEAGKITGLLH
ncbi:hypothetical protein D3C78_1872280 [compost metagenome]